jgi:hypothetical protein
LGDKLYINISNQLQFNGHVISNIKKYDALQSVIIHSADWAKTILVITRHKKNESDYDYTARILSEEYADGYELVKDSIGKYSLKKFEKSEMLLA